jgi:hypothetical protein
MQNDAFWYSAAATVVLTVTCDSEDFGGKSIVGFVVDDTMFASDARLRMILNLQ